MVIKTGFQIELLLAQFCKSQIDKPGPVVNWWDILFDIKGSPFKEDGSPLRAGDPGVYFGITLSLFGDDSLGPNDPWLPGFDEFTDPPYNLVKVWITGGTAKGVKPSFGCVTDGSADKTLFGDDFKSELVITACAEGETQQDGECISN